LSKQCWSCGARDGEAEFPTKIRRVRRECSDCIAERDKPLSETRIARPVMLSRRAWKARERVRQASLQIDSVDWLSGSAP
jgi:hypothetical protein